MANNRFGLLFEDDDDKTVVLPLPKKVSVVAEKKTSVDRPFVENMKKTEMENKSVVLNKNNAGQKANVGASIVTKQQRSASLSVNSNTLAENNWPDYNNEVGKRPGKAYSARYRKMDKCGSRKREFDRQSGSNKTGVKAVEKRNGGGAHNWGSVKQGIDDLKHVDMDNEDSGNEAAVAEPLIDDTPKQMGLDEWKALKEQRPKPNYNLRKAGEGENNPDWRKMIALAKKKQLNAGKDSIKLNSSLGRKTDEEKMLQGGPESVVAKGKKRRSKLVPLKAI
ncbi:intracellular hyaluronan-binding protein 4-like [Drosophila sulfurigaster albostrigata]|uniref:intracellular hyaluronan-binding protein 4-like n=1 Tax=Drosophila sulfurigaster albostrigata TaxID=89887 RepID=UPI002D21CE12|nr:intracellular hyaluronan-binding protein 4-like [Drosophila sulfurigaster albostrigata]